MKEIIDTKAIEQVSDNLFQGEAYFTHSAGIL